MSREYKLYLQDIAEATDHIRNFVGDLPFEDVVADPLRISAVLHKLAVIGESAKHVPEDVRSKCSTDFASSFPVSYNLPSKQPLWITSHCSKGARAWQRVVVAVEA